MPKKIVPLSDAKCRSVKFDPAGGNKYFDGSGLYLEVMASGEKRWRMRYMQATRKENLLTKGAYPMYSLVEAREWREEVRKLVDAGIDPAIEFELRRRTAATAGENTFELVSTEWFETKKDGWGSKHASRTWSLLEKDLFPAIGKRVISDITSAEVLKPIKAIEARGSHEMSRKGLEVAGLVFRYAMATSRARQDITVGLIDVLQPKPPVKHHPHVGAEGLATLLERIDGYGGLRETKIAMKIMMLTILRTAEMRWAEWPEIHWKRLEWDVPRSRMKGTLIAKSGTVPHIVPLARQTIALLEELRELTGRYRLMFPGVRNPAAQAMSENTINKALKSLGFQGEQTGHGLRGLASTIMNEKSGFHPDAIERQLAHIEPNKVRGAYDHSLHLEERHELMQWWADYIDQKSGCRGAMPNLVATLSRR